MAVNLEDAGFEVRDIVAWVYGSGFPKSLDIGKAIDKAAGAEREAIGEKAAGWHKNNSINDDGWQGENAESRTVSLTAPATDAAKQWDGWGSALKPAMELWTLCRKPLAEKTIAENVLTWGTGGLNIDGCRVGTDTIKTQAKQKGDSFTSVGSGAGFNGCAESTHTGRFPANLIHDGSDEVTAGFPQCKTGGGGITKENHRAVTMSKASHKDRETIGYNDNGSASRFFYCAKASKSERNAGLEGFNEKPNMRVNAPRESEEEKTANKQQNHHPTVKPLALMRYLCRLITPPNGIVLDPFTGSGSTGCGAIWEGFNFIGIERESDYAAIAQARITHAQKEKAADAASAQTNLF
jgi:site-specific DNA-methyltransferase (adenine-specific)